RNGVERRPEAQDRTAPSRRIHLRDLRNEPFRVPGPSYTELVQAVLDVSNDVAAELAGIGDGVLDALRDRLGCTVNLRGNRLTLAGGGAKAARAPGGGGGRGA